MQLPPSKPSATVLILLGLLSGGVLADGVGEPLEFGTEYLPHIFRWPSDLVAPADLDGDGDWDVVTAQNEGQLQVCWNDGSGNFLQTSSNVHVPSEVALVHDLNGDGRVDLLVRGAILRNDGINPKDPVAIVSVPAPWGDPACAVDVDADGRIDVVDRMGKVYRQLGDGGFALHQQLGFARASQAAAGDFDGDGRIDVVAADTPPTIYWNTGSQLTPWTPIPAGNSGLAGFGVVAHDFDRDGRSEPVVLCSRNGAGLAVIYDFAAGREASLATVDVPWAYDLQYPLYAGDLDLDGCTDLIGTPHPAPDPFSSLTTYMKGAAHGWFLPSDNTRLSFSWSFLQGVADLDGDGDLDGVTRHPNSSMAPVWKRNPRVSGPPVSPRQAWRRLHFGTIEPAGEAADSADPDGDGLENLIEYAYGTNPHSGQGADGTIGTPVLGGAPYPWCSLSVELPYPKRPDILYSVESSTGDGVWTTTSQWRSEYHSNGGWQGKDQVWLFGAVTGDRQQFVFTESFAPGQTPQVYLKRLRVVSR